MFNGNGRDSSGDLTEGRILERPNVKAGMSVANLIAALGSLITLGIVVTQGWGVVASNRAQLNRNTQDIAIHAAQMQALRKEVNEERRDLTAEITGYMDGQLSMMRSAVAEGQRRQAKLEGQVDLLIDQNERILKRLDDMKGRQ